MALLDQLRIPETKLDSVREGATKLGQDLAEELAKAGRQVHLEEWLDDLGRRVRAEVPRERLEAIVSRLQRELPDTDRDRYDRAYARGWTQARSVYLGVGVVAGIAAGIVAALFLDPKRGPERRQRVAARAKAVAARATEKAKQLAPSAPSTAADAPTEATEAALPVEVATPAPAAPLVPVMEPAPEPAAAAPADPQA